MKKRGQSEIITTVLLVLIALAAVAIIAVFVVGQVRDGIEAAEIRAKVSAVEMSVSEASAGNNYLLIQKTSNNPDISIANISLLINGESVGSLIDLSGGWGILETKRVNLTDYILQKGDKVEIYVIAGNVSKIIPVLITQTDIFKISITPLGKLNYDSSLVGYWASDGSSLDSLRKNNGVVKNISYSLGRSGAGQSFSFNGINSSVTLGNNFNASEMKTIAFWAKFNDFSKAQEIISKSANHCGLEFVNYGGSLGMYIMDETGYCLNVISPGASYITYSTSSLSLNKWYHLVAIQNGTFMAIYINGTQVVNGALTNTIGNIKSSSVVIPLMLGSWTEPASYPYGGQRYFNGSLDDIRIYNRTLSDSEIQTLYQYS